MACAAQRNINTADTNVDTRIPNGAAPKLYAERSRIDAYATQFLSLSLVCYVFVSLIAFVSACWCHAHPVHYSDLYVFIKLFVTYFDISRVLLLLYVYEYVRFECASHSYTYGWRPVHKHELACTSCVRFLVAWLPRHDNQLAILALLNYRINSGRAHIDLTLPGML